MNNRWEFASNEDIFKASLITNVEATDTALDMNDTPVRGKKTFTSTSPAANKYKSPYHEIEEILLRVVSPGYIRECIFYQGLSEVIIYAVGGTRFCQNVSREHSSNNIYYICNLGDLTLSQACHRCIGFRGEKIKLDSNVLNWIDEERSNVNT